MPYADSDICLEVFMSHWQQAWNIIAVGEAFSLCSSDDVETVIHNVEQMMNLLVEDDSSEENPSLTVTFFLENEVMEAVCNWISIQHSFHNKFLAEFLQIFEMLISQSRHSFLVHGNFSCPLVRLLMVCADNDLCSSCSEWEFQTVHLLHQLCTCVSQNPAILKYFVIKKSGHTSSQFFIFSVLIHHIHREDEIGQLCRDASLLLISLTAVNSPAGLYIGRSDFCSLMAAGLSGLYSSLAHTLKNLPHDWHAFTLEDCQRIDGIRPFLNSLEFCNAVAQVAHPLLRDQLINCIYNGFLLSVLGPAIHSKSQDEVTAATAYLNLFLQRITEPHLIRAFLILIFTGLHDDVPIVDSLIARINSSAKMGVVTLSLFNTLVSMNCEDVMYWLVFKYLVPCNFLMISRCSHVRDMDLYIKSAEKFLSLQPVCCFSAKLPDTQHSFASPVNRSGFKQRLAKVSSKCAKQSRSRGLFKSKRSRENNDDCCHVELTMAISDNVLSSDVDSSAADRPITTNFSEYLSQAHHSLEKCAHSCLNWSSQYDGPRASTDSIHYKTPSICASDRNSAMVGSFDGSKPDSIDEKLSNEERRTYHCSHADVAFSPIECTSHEDLVIMRGPPFPVGILSEEKDMFGVSECDVGTVLSSKYNSGSQSLVDLCPEDCSTGHIEGVVTDELLPVTCPSPSMLRMVPNLVSVDVENLDCDVFDIGPFLSFLDHSCCEDRHENAFSRECIDSFDKMLDRLCDQKATALPHLCKNSPKSAIELCSFPHCHVDLAYEVRGSDVGTFPTITAGGNTSPSSHLPNSSSCLSPPNFSIHSTCNGCHHHKVHLPESEFSQLHLQHKQRILQHSSSAVLLHSVRSSCAASTESLSSTSSSPYIGPFLAAVFGRLENMMQNCLCSNLLVTGLVARLAAYPQPLLLSFLLNVYLVFQPSVKSLIQVLSTLRQRIDNAAVGIDNFSHLILSARRQLMTMKHFSLPHRLSLHFSDVNVSPINTRCVDMTEKKLSITNFMFRRSSKAQPSKLQQKGHLKVVRNMHDTNPRSAGIAAENDTCPPSTGNVVYCAVVLEEFLKQLAALSLEQSVTGCADGCCEYDHLPLRPSLHLPRTYPI